MKLFAALLPFLICSQAYAADVPTVEHYMEINGIRYQKVSDLKPSIEVAPPFELSAREEARMKLLGETIATKTLLYERKLKKAARADELEQWKKDHPKLAMVRKYSGYGTLDKHVLLPTSDWWVDHEGLGIGVGAVASVVTAGAIVGGAAR